MVEIGVVAVAVIIAVIGVIVTDLLPYNRNRRDGKVAATAAGRGVVGVYSRPRRGRGCGHCCDKPMEKRGDLYFFSFS